MALVRIMETERLNLRTMTPEDAEFMLGLLNDPSFLRFIGDKGVKTPDDARRYILNGPVASYARYGFGLWLVELKTSNVPIGMCGLLKRETLTDVTSALPFFRGTGHKATPSSRRRR